MIGLIPIVPYAPNVAIVFSEALVAEHELGMVENEGSPRTWIGIWAASSLDEDAARPAEQPRAKTERSARQEGFPFMVGGLAQLRGASKAGRSLSRRGDTVPRARATRAHAAR
jgi:hypothetical protein